MISASQWLLTFLLNSLWQVPAIAFAAIIATFYMRPAGWRARHLLHIAALLLAVLLPAWSATTSMPRPGQSIAVNILPDGSLDRSAAVSTKAARIQHHFSASLHIAPAVTVAIVLVYLAFVLYRTGVLAWKWRATQTLRRNALPAELPAELASLWRSWKTAFRITKVDLLTSSAIPGPVTLGFRGTALLVPPDFIASATPEEISTALCHELAHIARRDFLLNLLIEIASLPIAFHPASWLLKKQIDESRELACDAMAADISSGSEVYARSLLSLAQTICAAPAATPTTALGIFEANITGNILEKRIMNLIDHEPNSSPAARLFCGLFGCLVLAASCVAISIFTLQPASAQTNSDLQAFLGTWKTTVNGQPAVSVQLMQYQGKLVGSVSNGDFDLDDKNNNAIRGWESHPGGAPIVEATVTGQTLNFKIMDSGGTLPWQLSLAGEGKAQLSITEPLPNGSTMPALEAVKDNSPLTAVIEDGAQTVVKDDSAPGTSKNDDPLAVVKEDGASAKDEEPRDHTDKPSVEPDSTPPHVISSANPEYTKEARAAKITGACVVGLTINEAGIPTNVHIVRSLDKGLDENAIKAVQKYRFTPAMKDGVAFAKDVKMEMNFQIY